MPTDQGISKAKVDISSLSTALLIFGIVLVTGTLIVSATTIPTGGASTETKQQHSILIGSQGGGTGWHKFGRVYRLNGTRIVWEENDAESYFDVTKTRNGTVLAGYMDSGYTSCGEFASPCARTGFQLINPDPTPQVTAQYSFPVKTRKNSEVHDIEPLQSGEFLLTDMEHERIFTVQNQTVTWQWNASEFYDAPPNPENTDWLHINDVDVITQDRYLVSVRNANQVLIIDRNRGVTEVINKDRSDQNDANCNKAGQLQDWDGNGNIRCGDPAILNHQHNPQWLGSNTILVADSENDRVVELHKQDGRWIVGWQLNQAGNMRLSWPRDADRLPNGNTLITDTLNRRIIEVNQSGAVLWSYKTARIPYEADHLPAGETVGAPSYNSDLKNNPSTTSEIPVISVLLVGLQAVYPSLPIWFGEFQLLLTLVALILIGSGLGLKIHRLVRNPDQ